MATKYQAQKAIKALSQDGVSADPNVQGFGISTVKAQDLKGEDGYVVVVYVTDMQAVAVQKRKTDTPNAASTCVGGYPDTVTTTSRSKNVTVPVIYIETGEFGFEY